MLKHLFLGIVLVVGYLFWTQREVVHGPGEIVPDTPRLMRLSWQKPFEFKGHKINPQRIFEGDVRVLAKKRYWFFDSFKSISPFDIYGGWGKLSDERNLDQMHFAINERQPAIKYSDPDLTLPDIHEQSDLFHILPANSKVKDAISRVRKGHIIYIKGYICNVETPAARKWKTSTRINDASVKSKKILWVEEIFIK